MRYILAANWIFLEVYDLRTRSIFAHLLVPNSKPVDNEIAMSFNHQHSATRNSAQKNVSESSLRPRVQVQLWLLNQERDFRTGNSEIRDNRQNLTYTKSELIHIIEGTGFLQLERKRLIFNLSGHRHDRQLIEKPACFTKIFDR